MNDKESWNTVMDSTEQPRRKMKAPALVASVVALHGLAIGAFLFIQGCGTTPSQPQVVEPPPVPVMPPSAQKASAVPAPVPRPVFHPSAPVEPVSMTAEQASGGASYEVRKGDSLSLIAKRHGVSAREIAELNNITEPNKIRLGQKLLLPAYAKEQPYAPPAAKPKAKSKATSSSSSAVSSSEKGSYEVKSGDSLSKIAARHGTTVKDLREANQLKNDMIRIGQKLVIPGKTAAAEKSKPAPEAAPEAAPAVETLAPPAPLTSGVEAPTIPPPPAVPPTSFSPADIPFEYTVKPGETLDDVARNFAVLKQDIISQNGITDPASVTAGQKLKIPLSSP